MRALLALACLCALAACGPAEAPAPAEAPPSPSAGSAALVTPEIQAALAALPAPYNEADYVKGRKGFGQCAACHRIPVEAGNSVGPNLHGVFGRKAGTVEGFSYSPQLQNSGIVWDADKVDHWLANPQTFLPGNRMTFVGIKDPTLRRDVIAYLMIESNK